jgi:sugar phosphate isomerase/epimerase
MICKLTCESIYIVGDSTIISWKKQFDIAKQLGVQFVTTEPPLKMWNSIDSLAGTYGIKVAIHEHWKGVSHYWDTDTTLMAIKDHPNFYVVLILGIGQVVLILWMRKIKWAYNWYS